MTDPINEILQRIKTNQKIRNTRFSASFLHNAGDILDRHGFGALKVFLLQKHEAPARVLLEEVIPLLENCGKIRQKRSIGHYIIKSLNAIKSREVQL